MNLQRIINLTPPTISQDHIEEKITCIRAHRERIFEVSMQRVNNKLIFHNYGQGGAGWTFLFGCVHESLRLFSLISEHPTLEIAGKNSSSTAMDRSDIHDFYTSCHRTGLSHTSIAVIGAGCYGLLTAILLKLSGYSVRIIAKELSQIASNKAAGFFFPRPRKSATHQERTLFESLGMESYATYLQIIERNHPFIKVGPKLLPGYYGPDIDPGFSPYISKGLISKPELVTIDFGNSKRYQVREYMTVFINSSAILNELHRMIKELNIPIIRDTVTSFTEISENFIFNCAGLGAKALTDDKRLIPVQGHLIALKNQPAAEQLQYMVNVKVIQSTPHGTPRDELIYYAPKGEGILGITFLRGQDSLTANPHEFDRLLERARLFFGS